MLNNSPCEVRISAKRHARFLTGFTLVEVLIVVVIIAILAALILPRMVAQTEKAYAAEALQMAGVIKRAAERTFDVTGSYPVGAAESATGNWGILGLQDLGPIRKWDYTYSGFEGRFIVAVYDSDGDGDDFSYTSTTGMWMCSRLFKFKDPSYRSKGCTV